MHNKVRFAWLFFIFLFFSLVSPGFIARSFSMNELITERDGNLLDYYLFTVGLGQGVESRYGHSIIRVAHKNHQEAHHINWGIFDFSDPMLPLNFFLGKLRYWAGDETYEHVYSRYRFYEKRSLVANKFNLTKRQKERFRELINLNLQGANRFFWYQYFYKNCATIPRDHLDTVLNGALKKFFAQKSASLKFRDYVRINLNRPPPVGFFLDIVMNSRLDQPMSQWEEMFYPPKLQEYLQDFPALDDFSRERPGQKLLSKPQELLSYKDVPSDSWHMQPLYLALGLLAIASFVLLLTQMGESRVWHWKLKLGLYFNAAILCFWSLFSGLVGLVMLLSWVFSEHLDLHHNANLWLFWPSDFIFAFFSISLLKQKKIWKKKDSFASICSALATFHLCVIPFWILLCLSGMIEQNCNLVMLYCAPVTVGYCTIIRNYVHKRRQFGI